MAESEIVDFNSLPENVKHLIEDTYRGGYVRQQITAKIDDVRFIIVGNRVLYGNWKTFPDFLTDYCKVVLGAEWGNEELKKPINERNQIIRWYSDWMDFSSSQEPMSDGTFLTVPSGPVSAWFHLAYDLYVLQHNATLQGKLIGRLKNNDQFQGARYEIIVAATFIRAGFKIDFEDDSDRHKKHPEFLATDTITREVIAVEAKSRHRPGILGRAGKREDSIEVQAGLGRLLQSALKKSIEMPLVVCIDFNLPPFTEKNVLEQPQVREFMQAVIDKEKKYPKDAFPITAIIATNFPHYYVSNETDDPRKDFIVSPSTYPKYPIQNDGFVNALYRSLNEYSYIPNYFVDSK